MDIKDFSYSWRFTNEDFALFSDAELSQIEVLSEETATDIWYSYCDERLLPKSYFVKDIIARKMPLLTADCGWGDEKAENATRSLLESTLDEYMDGCINVCFESEKALKVSTRLFCNKWSDFCYPSDYLIIDHGDKALLYYEDLIYYLDKIDKS